MDWNNVQNAQKCSKTCGKWEENENPKWVLPKKRQNWMGVEDGCLWTLKPTPTRGHITIDPHIYKNATMDWKYWPNDVIPTRLIA